MIPSADEHGRVVIEVHKREPRFTSVWFKRVEDVDLSRHCIYCLKGPKDPTVSARGYGPYRFELRPVMGIWYLCGVTYPYEWKKNAHLALLWTPGHEETYEIQGMTVAVTDFERITFGLEDVDRSDPHYGDPQYRTCRNWQFAHLLAKGGRRAQAEMKFGGGQREDG